jgi:D-alanyl-D-alanine carboxypeptidase
MSGVEKRLAAIVARHGVTGATAGVWDRSDMEGAAVGLADAGTGRRLTPPTVMQVASLTKPVVAASFLLNAPSHLDTPVIELVPELRPDWRASTKLTPRDLLSHTSGLHRDLGGFVDGDAALLEAVRQIVRHKQEMRRGKGWRYCNGGFWLAGLALARLGGGAFEEAVHKAVLGPATMAHSGFERPTDVALGHESGRALGDAYTRARRPGGGLLSNVGDLLRFAEFVMDRPSLLEQMTTPVARTTWGSWYGLGWELKGGLVWHRGSWGGYQTCLLLAPANRFAAVALVNDANGAHAAREIVAGEIQAATGIRSPFPGMSQAPTVVRALGQVGLAKATRFLS